MSKNPESPNLGDSSPATHVYFLYNLQLHYWSRHLPSQFLQQRVDWAFYRSCMVPDNRYQYLGSVIEVVAVTGAVAVVLYRVLLHVQVFSPIDFLPLRTRTMSTYLPRNGTTTPICQVKEGRFNLLSESISSHGQHKRGMFDISDMWSQLYGKTLILVCWFLSC